MVKDIVVNLTGAAPQEFAADYAISLAQLFEAHIAGVGFIYEPVIPGTVLGGIPTDLIEAQREENTKTAKAATSRFEAAAARAGLSAEIRILDASVAGAADLFGRIARRFDLAVVGQARPREGASEELLIEGALFESGRPVVVVPFVQTKPVTLERVLVCWDGSRPATRAIADALPFLRRAKAIDIVAVSGERGKGSEMVGTNMARHLARHGLAVELKRVSSGDVDVPAAIRAQVTETGADFMVMGGYGHSRLREFILGGVTRTILTSSTIPVLMSH
ncbi:MAG TPA: universal stress protein [Xanthobacteraceae bacterium]|jgi:nucleotide-binding universal stress UspA family protein